MTFSNQKLIEQLFQYQHSQTGWDSDSQRRPLVESCRVQQGPIEISEQDLENTITAHVTPLDDYGKLGTTTKVDLNILDGREVSFHHQLPLSARRAFVSVDDEYLGSWEAIVDLSWCRFNRRGYYTSGGRFAVPATQTA